MVTMLRISEASLRALDDVALNNALAHATAYLLGPRPDARGQAAIAVARPRARAMRLQTQGHFDAFLALVLDLGDQAEPFLDRPDNAATIAEPKLEGHQKLFLLIERAGAASPAMG